MNNVFTGENPTTNVFIGQHAADKILLHQFKVEKEEERCG